LQLHGAEEGGRPWRGGCARGGGGVVGSVREGEKGRGHGLVAQLGLPGCSGPKRLDGPAGPWADWAESFRKFLFE
jgi:hypothetical protein